MKVKELKELLSKVHDEDYEVVYEGSGDRFIRVEAIKRVVAENYAGTQCFVKAANTDDPTLGYTLSRSVIVLV